MSLGNILTGHEMIIKWVSSIKYIVGIEYRASDYILASISIILKYNEYCGSVPARLGNGQGTI